MKELYHSLGLIAMIINRKYAINCKNLTKKNQPFTDSLIHCYSTRYLPLRFLITNSYTFLKLPIYFINQKVFSKQ